MHCTPTRHSCSSNAIDPGIGAVLDTSLSFRRQLDSGNAQPAALAADFSRFDFVFWTTVEEADARNAAHRRKLEALNAWRNAIAHHDIDSNRADLRPREVTLAACNSWRAALNGLAESFDRVLADHLATLLDSRPW